MSWTGRLRLGLVAAARLARGRGDGALLLAADAGAPRFSFWAMALCIPLVLLPFAVDPSAGGVHAQRQEALVFVVGWLAFAEATRLLAKKAGALPRWLVFIAIWNWCNVSEGVILLLGSVPRLAGAPAIVAQAAELAAIGWALWTEWFAIRIGLGATARGAVLLVILDQAIGIFLASLAAAVSP